MLTLPEKIIFILAALATLAIQRAQQKGKTTFSESLIAFADPVFERADATPSAATSPP